MTTCGFHSGPRYNYETRQQLDKLFNAWLDLDAVAENRGYEDVLRNEAADKKYAEYELALEIADRIYAGKEAERLANVLRRQAPKLTAYAKRQAVA